MKRLLLRLAENIDAIVALFLGVVVSLLSLFGHTSAHTVEDSILITLAVLSFALLRDRWNEDDGYEDMARRVGRLDQTTARMQTTVEGLATVKTLRGVADINQAFALARQHTDRWVFKGGTGTYTRAVTLPLCLKSAGQDRRSLRVRLEIVDPTNVALCERYANYRSSISQDRPDGTGEVWTLDRTRKESFATVLAACWYKRTHRQLLDIQVGLASTVSMFRYDLSMSRIIITQDDSEFPATVISSESPLYDGYDTELRSSFAQTRQVDLAAADGLQLSPRPTPAEVRRLFVPIGVPLPENFSDDDLEEIIRKALKAKNPYVDPA